MPCVYTPTNAVARFQQMHRPARLHEVFSRSEACEARPDDQQFRFPVFHKRDLQGALSACSFPCTIVAPHRGLRWTMAEGGRCCHDPDDHGRWTKADDAGRITYYAAWYGGQRNTVFV